MYSTSMMWELPDVNPGERRTAYRFGNAQIQYNKVVGKVSIYYRHDAVRAKIIRKNMHILPADRQKYIDKRKTCYYYDK